MVQMRGKREFSLTGAYHVPAGKKTGETTESRYISEVTGICSTLNSLWNEERGNDTSLSLECCSQHYFFTSLLKVGVAAPSSVPKRGGGPHIALNGGGGHILHHRLKAISLIFLVLREGDSYWLVHIPFTPGLQGYIGNRFKAVIEYRIFRGLLLLRAHHRTVCAC